MSANPNGNGIHKRIVMGIVTASIAAVFAAGGYLLREDRIRVKEEAAESHRHAEEALTMARRNDTQIQLDKQEMQHIRDSLTKLEQGQEELLKEVRSLH